MFEDLIKQLDRLEKGMRISVPIKEDEEGYLDKECPSEECLTKFKILSEDWKNIVRDEEVFCPICRHVAPSDKWFTTNQVERVKNIAKAQVHAMINDSMRSSVRNFNNRQGNNSFLSITAQYQGKPVSIPMPPEATDPMKLKITCTECKCRYAVIGAGFFCPSCGNNSAVETFNQSIQKAKNTLDIIEQLGEISVHVGQDHTENAKQMMLEKCIDTGVMAFQRAVEVIYKNKTGAAPEGKNTFQRLSQGSDLWKSVTGKGYNNYLSDEEFKILNVHFQQRHLFSHCEGIIDEDYIKKSGDTRYAIGQRVVLKREPILNFLTTLEKLFNLLRT